MYILTISLRSPFARRVRVLLDALGLKYELKVEDVFNPSRELMESNPLARVPVLTTPSGEKIVDSHEIQTYFRMQYAHHPIFQTGAHGMSVARALSLSGIAAGLTDVAVGYFLETLRSPGQKDPATLKEFRDAAVRSIKHLEQELGEKPFFAGANETVIDLDVVCALTYAKKRIAAELLDDFPKLKGMVERLETKPSFTSSFPPA